MEHQLIIIDGQSTVGKSTTSQSVCEQIVQQRECYWLHEECDKHPIRDGEFSAGELTTLEDMALNKTQMLDKWQTFSSSIVTKGKVCITEGCLLHSIDRYLLISAWEDEQILQYFAEVMKILAPLNPLIVFLCKSDLKSSFEAAYKIRGDWWRDLILKRPQACGYFKTHEYTGDESIYAAITYEQDKMAMVFESLNCDKLKINTMEEKWDRYVQEIVEKAGFSYSARPSPQPDVEKYCGNYRAVTGDTEWHINYDIDKRQYFMTFFWPFMPLKFLGDDCFELVSFPIKLCFNFHNDEVSFHVSGNYDWEYNDRVFRKFK